MDNEFIKELQKLLKKYDVAITPEMTIEGEEAVIQVMDNVSNLDGKSNFAYFMYLNDKMNGRID